MKGSSTGSPSRATSAPLADSYPTKVLLVLGALCPFIVASTATTLLQPALLGDLHATRTGLQLADGLANAGYAFGAVLAVALIKRRSPRPLLVSYELTFVIGSVVTATAPDVGAYTAGRLLQGFATGLLLVAALPPLVTVFPAAKLPFTVVAVDVGLFGATTLGPIVGGLAGAHDAWRLMFWVLAGVGAATLVTGWLSVPPGDALDPDGRLDKAAVALAAAATALPFFGASELAGEAFLSVWVLPALVVGLASLVTLIVAEYRRPSPLTPVKLLAHTFPVTGLVAAMAAGAAVVAVLELTETFLVTGLRTGLPEAGLLFWPSVVALAAAAVLFGALFRTRSMPLVMVLGAAALIAATVTIATVGPGTGHAEILLVAAAIGFGAGATVSPGLFLAGLSVPSTQLGPAFALVELLRSEAAFLVAPILLHVAMGYGRGAPAVDHGIRVASTSAAILVGAGVVVCLGLWRLGGARLQRPDLVGWVEEGGEAFDSPPVAAAVR